jgi:hypothetical protein
VTQVFPVPALQAHDKTGRKTGISDQLFRFLEPRNIPRMSANQSMTDTEEEAQGYWLRYQIHPLF